MKVEELISKLDKLHRSLEVKIVIKISEDKVGESKLQDWFLVKVKEDNSAYVMLVGF